MAVEVSTIPLLFGKLCNLRYDDLTFDAGLRNRIHSTMTVLESIFESIGVVKKLQHTSETIVSLLSQLPRRLNLIEDITDTLLVKKELRRRQKSLMNNKMYCMRPLILWTSRQDQILFRNQLEEFLTYAKELMSCAEELYKEVKKEEKEPPRVHADITPQVTRTKSLSYLEDDDSDCIVGFEKEAKDLAERLISRDYDWWSDGVTAVTGKAGSGKTALTKMIYNRPDVKQHYSSRAWVSLYKDFEFRDILVNILTQLNGKKQVENTSEEIFLRQKLIKLLGSQACLIVIDDVSTPKDIERVLPVLEIEGPSHVIISSRNKNTIHGRWYNDVIELRGLTDEESWRLFLKKANIAEVSWKNNDPVLINLKENILRKCDGWPLAIVILGGLLSTRDLSEWSSVIEHPNFQEDILALSHQDLSSQMKSCFLYLGIFPREFEIPIRRLFHLWLAEGLVTPLGGVERNAPEDVVEEYFKKLVERNMIEVARLRSDGTRKTCRMPGSLWDKFHPIAVDFGLFHEHNTTTNYTSAEAPKSNVRRLAETSGINNYPSSDHYMQHLRSYISFNTRKRDSPSQEIGMFLNALVKNRGFGLLVVLDLEGVYKPVLPETVGKFFHLKYVGLRWTFLDSLPMSIGDIPNLETLDVKHTNISVLPSSIWKAKKLRHLYLNENHLDVSTQRPYSGSLINLQTLWGLYIGNNSFLMDYLYALVGLRKLGLTFHSTSSREIANWISKLKNLQSLRLRSCDEFGRPLDLLLRTFQEHEHLTDLYLLGKLPKTIGKHHFPANLKILTLSASLLEEDPMPMLRRLLHLNILRLYGYSYLGKQLICLREGFPQLRVLKLWFLENLEECIVEKGAMPGLIELEIRSCNKLKKVTGYQEVTTLKDIILTNMPEDFVADVKGIMNNDVFIKVNNWEFAPLQAEGGSGTDEQELDLKIAQMKADLAQMEALKASRDKDAVVEL